MKIFVDILNGKCLATDATIKPVLVDDFVYEFTAKKCADGGDEDADDSVSISEYNDAFGNKLKKCVFMDKMSYLFEVYTYLKKLAEKMLYTNKERLVVFGEKSKAFYENLKEKLDKIEFYVHAYDNREGMIVIREVRKNEQGEETYIFQFFKDGLLERDL